MIFSFFVGSTHLTKIDSKILMNFFKVHLNVELCIVILCLS